MSASGQVGAKAAPRIRQQPLPSRQQPGAHRIEMHKVAGRAQVAAAAALHQLRSVPPAEPMAEEFVPVIEPNGVRVLQPSHAGDQIGVRRFQHQMIMVAHQTIRVNPPVRFLAGFRQRLEEILPIHIIQKYILPPVPPAHDMIHRPGILDT